MRTSFSIDIATKEKVFIIDGVETRTKLTEEEIIIFNAEQRFSRENEYKEKTDPLFFKWQSGEIEKEKWEEERNKIKNSYPYIIL